MDTSSLQDLPEFKPRRLPASPAGLNPIQEFLDQQNFPWTVGLAELENRYGVSMHPSYKWELVAILPDPLPFLGMLFPVATHASSPNSSSGVPDYYFTNVWVTDDALTNLQQAHDALAPFLGPAAIGRHSSNAIGCAWRSGPAEISLLSFPPSPKSFPSSNPAQDREQRLITACLVAIYPGYRARLTPQERDWVGNCVPIMTVSGLETSQSVEALYDRRSVLSTAEFARDPVDDCLPLLGQVSRSSDGQGLVICVDSLLVIPMDKVLGIGVQKRRKARGPGGSWLTLTCQAGSCETEITIGRGAAPNDLDRLAKRLGRDLDRPVLIGQAYEDA